MSDDSLRSVVSEVSLDSFDPANPGEAGVRVQFTLSNDGIFKVRALSSRGTDDMLINFALGRWPVESTALNYSSVMFLFLSMAYCWRARVSRSWESFFAASHGLSSLWNFAGDGRRFPFGPSCSAGAARGLISHQSQRPLVQTMAGLGTLRSGTSQSLRSGKCRKDQPPQQRPRLLAIDRHLPQTWGRCQLLEVAVLVHSHQ